jgi:hypothetical protein
MLVSDMDGLYANLSAESHHLRLYCAARYSLLYQLSNDVSEDFRGKAVNCKRGLAGAAAAGR